MAFRWKRLSDLGGEERRGIEGGLMTANAGEVELVAAHGEADASFDAGGEFGEEVLAVEGGTDGAVLELRHLGLGESF